MREGYYLKIHIYNCARVYVILFENPHTYIQIYIYISVYICVLCTSTCNSYMREGFHLLFFTYRIYRVRQRNLTSHHGLVVFLAPVHSCDHESTGSKKVCTYPHGRHWKILKPLRWNLALAHKRASTSGEHVYGAFPTPRICCANYTLEIKVCGEMYAQTR